jgi:FAD/FMN-containing dehydrogenase
MTDQLIAKLRDALGDHCVLFGSQIEQRYKTDWSRTVVAEPLAVVRPTDTAGVARVLEICCAYGQSVTVQGGMTGLVGGSQAADGDVVVSLERLTGIEDVDVAASTMTVWAGTPLQMAQQAAADHNLYLAIDLGARGSCQIGGNIATNAGGNRVIRYGMMREQVLGLEVVLADGTVLSHLNKMLKNNAGYDLKQLFIGTEGTLGIVTKAVLRLHPIPSASTSVLCALNNESAVIAFLARVRQRVGSSLLAFELMWPEFYQFMTQRVQGNPKPLESSGSLVLLMECATGNDGISSESLEELLALGLQEGELTDAVVAQSGAQAEAFWRIRDSVSEFPTLFAPYCSFDVSIPITQMQSFVTDLRQILLKEVSNSKTMFFGHIGDSNLHIVVHVPTARETFPKHQIDELVYTHVRQHSGSISAEHGIGTRKKQWLNFSRSEAEIALMRTLKNAFDPKHILNPGKVV